MDRRFLAILAVLVIAVGGFLYFGGKKDSNSGSNSSGNSSVSASNHVFGEGKKNVKLIEYGDFQCPACGQYYPIVEQVKEKYKSDIIFQFRNFPLDNIHPNARAAHRSAEAAAKQNKFWEMYNKLYSTQKDWVNSSNVKPIFEGYATDLGLNMTKFKTDFASEEVNSIINADIQEGTKIGANSTPTFVLDGVKIENPRSLDEFNQVIDDAIAKQAKKN